MGFYFEDRDDYEAKAGGLTDRFGNPIEQFDECHLPV